MRCPNCHHDNIPGVDLCEACGSDLAGLDLPEAGPGFRGRLLTDHVGDLARAAPISVSTETPVAEVIDRMRRAGHGCALVEDESRLVGIFTERDVLTRVVRPQLNPEELPIGEVMTASPIRLEADDPPAFAIHLSVARGLRHLPVLRNERLLGFLSVRHLLRHIYEDVLGRK